MGVFILLYRKSVFHECRPMQRVTENAKVQQVHPFAVKKRTKTTTHEDISVVCQRRLLMRKEATIDYPYDYP